MSLKSVELILVTSTHKLGVSSFILMIQMATLGPFRKYLRAANLKSRSKVFKATYAFIRNSSLKPKVYSLLQTKICRIFPEMHPSSAAMLAK